MIRTAFAARDRDWGCEGCETSSQNELPGRQGEIARLWSGGSTGARVIGGLPERLNAKGCEARNIKEQRIEAGQRAARDARMRRDCEACEVARGGRGGGGGGGGEEEEEEEDDDDT